MWTTCASFVLITATAASAVASALQAHAMSTFVSLWESESEARRAPTQSGASNCGETAVQTCLLALRLPEDPMGSVTVRARDYSTPSLIGYLKSRGNAGCTGADLVAGASSLSGSKACAKFFACGPEQPTGLTRWLAEWIAKGGAPIVTINTQLDVAVREFPTTTPNQSPARA